jgi:hypothetical protein
MAYTLRAILLGSLYTVATAQTAMSRHMPARPFAVDPTLICASRCTISRGQILCPKFLVTPDHYPLGCSASSPTQPAPGR